jgi:hypothetical protein
MTNFIPKSVFKFKDSQGNISTAEEWDFASLGSGTGPLSGNFIPVLLISTLFAIICGPILLILSLINFTGKKQILNVIAIVIGGYILIDFSHEWLLLMFTRIFLSDNIIYFFVTLNISALIGNIIILFISIFFGEKSGNLKPFIIIMIGVLFFSSFTLSNNHIFKEREKTYLYDGNKISEGEKDNENYRMIEEIKENETKQNIEDPEREERNKRLEKEWGN